MSRLALALWLEHRAEVEVVRRAAAARGIEIQITVPPPVIDAPFQAPWLETARFTDRLRLQHLLKKSGWRGGELESVKTLVGTTTRWERRGLVLWVGKPALSPYRGVRLRSRVALPIYSLLNAMPHPRKYEMAFAGMQLWVPVGVFKPHPGTRAVVDAAQQLITPVPRRVIDVGTGSGAIALALAHAWPAAHVIGIDRSARAVACARANARRFRRNNAEFRLGDLLQEVGPASAELITGNLAWLAPAAYVAFGGDQREYRGPPSALLDEHADGMGYFRRLVPQAKKVLTPGGWILLQLSPLQLPATRDLLESCGFSARLLGDEIIAGQLVR
ncbi:MAG: methyltransferase [Gemmatimonadota bacterium]